MVNERQRQTQCVLCVACSGTCQLLQHQVKQLCYSDRAEGSVATVCSESCTESSYTRTTRRQAIPIASCIAPVGAATREANGGVFIAAGPSYSVSSLVNSCTNATIMTREYVNGVEGQGQQQQHVTIVLLVHVEFQLLLPLRRCQPTGCRRCLRRFV